jgi:two-component system, OmpR family, phosphate regulon sensor histidine kinase PhoR
VTEARGNILVIDDEPGMRQGMKRLLEMHGLHVDTVATGEEGISQGIKNEYDLYFIDLKMPDIDGTEVLRAIRLAYPESICIVMTAFASIDSAVTTTQIGAYRYIPKPFDPDELTHLVDTALGRRALILETRRLQEDRQKQMLELSLEQSRLRTIISALDDGILVVNQQLDIVLFNNSFTSLLEIKEPMKIGSAIQDCLPDGIFQQLEELFRKNHSFKAIKQEIIIHPPAEKVVMFNTTPIQDDDGELLGIVSVVRDITELKKIDVMRSQFVNMAAHELKAPLSAVQGYLEILVDESIDNSPEISKQYLGRSLARTKALVSLINDLLNISRMEAGTIRREIEPIDLSTLLVDLISSMQTEIDEQQLAVKSLWGKDLYVDADRDELSRLFKHLIGNAIKYSQPHGDIAISTEIENNYIKTKIVDTGIGMTEDEQNRLFEEFFRAKNKHTRSITGTGLGLSIAKKIVDAYAGIIEVESDFEKGSTFTVLLPISKNI